MTLVTNEWGLILSPIVERTEKHLFPTVKQLVPGGCFFVPRHNSTEGFFICIYINIYTYICMLMLLT